MSEQPVPSRRALLAWGGVAASASLAGCAGSTTPSGADGSASAASASAAVSPSATAGSATPNPTPSAVSPSADGRAPEPSVAKAPGPDIMHGPRERNEVTLTFHGAGSADITRGVKDALAAGGVHATIFAVGLWVQQDPSQVQSLHEAGHEIGNHTFNHLDLLNQTAATVRSEIGKARDVLTSAIGDAGWWFRPSGTSHSNDTIRAVAGELGYGPCISYDVDPEDFRDPGAALVRSRTAAAMQPGSIVSLHLGHPGTVTALPGILEDLAARGLRAVTLSTLLRD